MKALVINLARAPDRREYMAGQLNKKLSRNGWCIAKAPVAQRA